jgi:fatty acid desaturase
LNDWLAEVFCLWPIATGLHGYRRWHLAHHRWLGTADDPELIVKARAHGNAMPDRLLKVKLIICDFVGLGAVEILQAMRAIRPAQRRDVWGPILWHAAALAILGWRFEALWFGSLFTSHWAIFRYRIWREHQGRDPFSDPTWNLAVRWWEVPLLPHGVGYHHAHHASPSIPFHGLFATHSKPPVTSPRHFPTLG